MNDSFSHTGLFVRINNYMGVVGKVGYLCGGHHSASIGNAVLYTSAAGANSAINYLKRTTWTRSCYVEGVTTFDTLPATITHSLTV